MFLSSLLTASAFDIVEPIAKWTTVGLVIAAMVACFILFFVKRTMFARVLKYTLFGLFVYLLALAILLFSLDIAKHYSDAYAEENWLDKQALVQFVLIPLVVLAALALCALVAFAVSAKYAPTRKKLIALCGGILTAIALISALVCLAIYYNKKIANDGYYNSDSATVKQLALYISALLAVAAIVGLSLFDKQKLTFDSHALAYAGICTAMSFALSYIKLWDMPAGGSVTLVSLLPLMLYGYIFGAKKGVFVGFVYGILQAVQDPWLIHPAQFLLDYPIAFSAVGLAGLTRKLPVPKKLPQVKFAIGAVLAGCMRFICHVLSGALAFEAYAKGQNVWVYSLGYNSYVFIDAALVVAVGIFVLSSKAFLSTVMRLNKEHPNGKNEQTTV